MMSSLPSISIPLRYNLERNMAVLFRWIWNFNSTKVQFGAYWKFDYDPLQINFNSTKVQFGGSCEDRKNWTKIISIPLRYNLEVVRSPAILFKCSLNFNSTKVQFGEPLK